MAEKQDRQRLLTGNLTLLMALEANGLDKQAGALVEKIGEGLRRRPAAKAVDQARVELQPAERGRSTHDIARLDDINARLIKGYRSDKRSTAEDKREADLKARQELENRLDVKRDTQAVRLGIEESAELAATRGETISEDKSGVKRILDRDPLLSLARCGKLSADQLEVGQIVREMYDARGEDAGAIEYTGMPGSAHDHEKFVSRRFTRAKACARIGQIERALAGRKPYDPNALVMLRWVCEQGHSLTSKGRGRAYDRNAASLALALDVADDVLQRRA